VGNCLDHPDTCECLSLHSRFPYTREGRLPAATEAEGEGEGRGGGCEPYATPLFECHAMCACDPSCSVRLVDNGIRVRLQIFYTTNARGWGLRTLADLPRGTFVCEYAGELLSQAEAERRWTFQEAHGIPNYILSASEHL